MELIYIFLSCHIWFPLESQSQVCDTYQQPSVKVCTDQDVTHKILIYIDAISAPDFKRLSCECVITPYKRNTTYHLKLLSLKSRFTSRITFEINYISIGMFYSEGRTKLTGATKLFYSKLQNHESEGACLAVFSDDATGFNISCTKATKTTQMQITTTNLSKRSETFSIPSKIFNISSTRATRRAKKQTSTLSVSRSSETTQATLELEYTTIFRENDKTAAVIPSVICAILLVIIICLVIYIRRMRRRYENQHQLHEHPNTQQLSEMEIRSEQVPVAISEASAAIASLNEYERLNMYISPNCNAEMYQQLNIANA